MLEDFLSYIVHHLSVNKTDKILLAVSGGIDSMVMLDLFRKCNFHIEVAHIDHSTRNGESSIDALFVSEYCQLHDISCHIKKLDYKILSNGNFQANARKERYSFFEEIMSASNINHLATAHHKDDRLETFIMNLNRKSGLNGLTSLRARNISIIRPLLNINKSDILEYAKKYSIKYREDSSNLEDDYTRNRVRHYITKSILEVFPDFISNSNHSFLQY